MQAFIQGVFEFIAQIYTYISNTIGNTTSSSELYRTWVNKQVISGDLISVGMTWRELLLYVSTWVVTILFIIFIFKLVSGVIRFFFIGK